MRQEKKQKSRFRSVKVHFLLLAILLTFFCLPCPAWAENETASSDISGTQSENTADIPPVEPMVRGKVLEIRENKDKETTYSDSGYKVIIYDVKLSITSGVHKGETVTAEHIVDQRMVYNLQVDAGDEVLIFLEEDENGRILNAYIAEIYRQKYLGYLVVFFLILLVAFGGIKGLKTIVTLGLTGLAILKILLPGLLKGYNPVFLTIGVCAAVTALTLLLIGGFNKKTVSAILGTTAGVICAGILALIFGTLAKLTGLGEQETQMLAFIPQSTGFDYKGLLFAGIIIGALGAVMDVAMSIASAMSELEAIKPDISNKELIGAGMNIGKDIMGTMANTLILAYVGTALPILLLFMANNIPAGEFLNWDMIASEVVRSLVGSIGLIFTIPLTALVAAFLRTRFALRK